MMEKKTFWLLAVILVFALFVAGCGGDDDDTTTDGDTTDGDTADGDQTIVDGDTADGDVVVDGDTADGDQTVDGDAVAQLCTPQADELCFDVENGDLAGSYVYGQFTAVPTSGCHVVDSELRVEMYDPDNSYTTIKLTAKTYDGAGTYTGLDKAVVQWSLNDIQTDTTVEYWATTPCTITVVDDNNGSFDCLLYDPQDSADNFHVTGAFSCAAE